MGALSCERLSYCYTQFQFISLPSCFSTFWDDDSVLRLFSSLAY